MTFRGTESSFSKTRGREKKKLPLPRFYYSVKRRAKERGKMGSGVRVT